MVAQTVKKFVEDSYSLINASSPTVPLHGDDMSKGVQYLNELIRSYSGTGLLLTVADTKTTVVGISQENVTFADPDYLPLADIPEGRLANLENAWLELSGVTYPLNITNRNEFLAAYKYEPLQGLPRFAIVFPEVDVTRVRLYPAPSQAYEFFAYGKYELSYLTQNDNMAILPGYYLRYLRFALAKDIAMYKGRSDAWGEKLESMLLKAEQDMISVSSVNLKIEDDYDDFLNGAYRVRAGI